ncbi:caspase-8 [Engraulis encrasicolus]|uniref:caspase-8 n=1 Tax=Engraulis encrasicolus TaxID=184585 RepID=UPI002FD73FC1
MEFQTLLLNLERSLSDSDFQALKFLCVDLVERDLSGHDRGAELFTLLMDQDHLTDEKRSLLTELLQSCHRQDLIKKLELPAMLPGEFYISEYRKLLFGLSENITEKELGSMKFLLMKSLPRKKLQDDMTTLQLLLEMEKEDKLSCENLDTLRDMLKSICPCLVKRIDNFKSDTSQRPTGNHVSGQPSTIGPVCQETGGKANGVSYEVSSTEHPAELSETSISESHHSVPTSDLENMSIQSSLVDDDDVRSHNLDYSSLPGASNLKDEQSPLSSSPLAEMDLPKYDMKGDKRGVCLIINNHNFSRSVKKLGNRDGTECDERVLKDVFTWLKFDVAIKRDCSKQEMLKVLKDLSQRDHSAADCLVCCVLSHGLEGTVYGVDGLEVRVQQLTEPFAGNGCASLVGKPKLFFIQACQGTKEQQTVPIQSDGPVAWSTSVDAAVPDQRSFAPSIPDGADFLLGMATIPEHASFRDTKDGTWFIQSLCETLRTLVPKGIDLLSIMTEVNNDVSRKAYDHRKQMPQPVYSLRKRVVFPIPSKPAPKSVKHKTFFAKMF